MLGGFIYFFIPDTAVNQEFRLFVQNSANKIRENVNISLWRYCGADENPVDIIARLSSLNNSSDNLSNNSIWWDGPFVFKRDQRTIFV